VQPVPGKYDRALRLIFEYDGNQVRLLSRQPVAMVVPPSDPVAGYQGQKGCWCEVLDATGQVLFRRVLHDPIRADVEVFSNDPQRSLSRHPLAHPKGGFAVVVPDLDRAKTLTLWEVAVYSLRRVERPEPTAGHQSAGTIVLMEVAGRALESLL
jgi:hypothetical protein